MCFVYDSYFGERIKYVNTFFVTCHRSRLLFSDYLKLQPIIFPSTLFEQTLPHAAYIYKQTQEKLTLLDKPKYSHGIQYIVWFFFNI